MRDTILRILNDLCPDIDFERETKLVDDGLLDSFTVIQIVTSFMEEFDISIDADDIEPENLNSIDGMCKLIENKLQG